MSLPEHDYPVAERVEVHGQDALRAFDLNDYPSPHPCGRTLTVLADSSASACSTVRLYTHLRSWDRGAQIEQEAHVQDLVAHSELRAHTAPDRLTQAASPG
jgi:hypothetical protein